MPRRWLSALLLACTLATGSIRPAVSQPSGSVVVTVGPAELVRGPDNASDTAFHTLNSEAGLHSYVANGVTWSSRGGSLETLPLQTAPALVPGVGFDLRRLAEQRLAGWRRRARLVPCRDRLRLSR